MNRAYGFVDGGFLRELAKEYGMTGKPNPHTLVSRTVINSRVRSIGQVSQGGNEPTLMRVTYYDAAPDSGAASDDLEEYWKAIELIQDTELGFGVVRGRKRKRQKRVDTLLVVDMLVGAFTNIYDVAILVAGDADFVPVVNEVRRRGVTVVLVSSENAVSDDLRRAADRFITIAAKETDRFGPEVTLDLLDTKLNAALPPTSA